MPISEAHLIDNMEFMDAVEDNFFDVSVTSPPYNLGSSHHTGNRRFTPYSDDLPEDVYQKQQIEVLDAMFHVFKEGGSVFYNHKNRIKDGKQISPYEWLFKTKWTIKQELVWFNGSQNFDKCRFYPMTERIYWLSKGKDTKFHNAINHHDLFHWEAEGTNKEHKRAFPLRMVRDLLACFPSGLNVFEPYLGSGSSRLAAHDLGFHFWGCETNPDYFKSQEERFRIHTAQARLFEPEPVIERQDGLFT